MSRGGPDDQIAPAPSSLLINTPPAEEASLQQGRRGYVQRYHLEKCLQCIIWSFVLIHVITLLW